MTAVFRDPVGPAGPDEVSAEVAWAIAESVQVTPVSSGLGCYLGMAIARPHATGWFFSARSRRDLSDGERAQFNDFVALRVYLLLTQGPQAPVWEPIADGGYIAHPAEELLELEATELIPDTVPSGWN